MYPMLLLVLLFTAPLQDLAPPPAAEADLIVTIHDVAQQAVPNVAVQVLDGDQVVATASTDVAGTATFAGLPANEVRVRVTGQLPSGPRLVLTGMDVGGIPVFLSSGAATLSLRVSPGGAVVIDPTSFAREVSPSGPDHTAPLGSYDPAAPLPTAPPVQPVRTRPPLATSIATTLPPVAPVPDPATTSPVAEATAPPPVEPATSPLHAALLAALAAIAALAAVILSRSRR